MTTKNLSPYELQKQQHFWKTGVAQVNLGTEQFELLSNLAIDCKKGAIASIGSCFAQHVGKWLINNNYPFIQSKLDSTQVSSFALGNIYTPRCFLQWLKLDNNENHQHDIYYCQKTDTYLDLLRPNVYPQGFTSKSELEYSRLEAKEELISTLSSTNTLIFTLGLTEAWKDGNNIYYPSCPGIIAGKFDKEIYKLHEFNYNEILSDLLKIHQCLKELNPNLNIILTVSPVPLTATATDKHILVASQYSKAVLRAVAGYLSDSFEDMNYFPSFEIISVNSNNDFRFEDNRRTVSASGVEYVMKHFQTALNVSNTLIKPPISSAINEIACEEEQLEAFSLLSQSSQSQALTQITLVGDSHMGKLSTALKALNTPFSGGMIMNGSGFAQKKFALCKTEYFVPLENAPSRQLWASALLNIKSHEKLGHNEQSIIISNIGLQTHQNAARFAAWLQAQDSRINNPLGLQNFVDFFHEDQSEQLSILISLKDNGHNVIVVSDPPFSQYFDESKSASKIIYAYHSALRYVLEQFDIPFFDAARLFDEEITEPMEYVSNVSYSDGQHDWIHGNELYYEWLSRKLLKFTEKV
ncbi:GSCFA domain-containing protein [Shewanella sp. MF05960]|uniref:GSCFA domain-containing protein n=1 Tax=Shewanella sp. MF05960 TaxID=3434874 RepID=UPI003D7B97AE